MFEIVHLHIPKTGGSSLLELYRHHIGSDSVITVKRSEIKDKSAAEIMQFLNSLQAPEKRVLHGHFYWNEVAPFFAKSDQIKLVAFFRHPVERVISNFFFFKKRISEGKVTAENKHRMKESLLEYAALPESRNRMSSFLKGLDPDDLFFAGLMENFEADLRELFLKLGYRVSIAPRANINSGFLREREMITESERELLARYNQEDMDLYQRILLLKNRKRSESV